MESRTGEVWLVGAGPGDPGLLTIRGREVLERADVVVHDRLANPDLLRLAPRARFVDVGKSPDGRGYRQEEINRLLVDLARQGNVVVRLKGGDPFIFGRGGEEALALAAAGIPFRVVPGVTAASGCAAWAGVPLTHRGLASSLALVTGHEDPGKAAQVDWRRLATATDTLVVYMGVGRLGEIVEELLAGGRRGEEPALLVQDGTRATQKVVRGTLAELPARAREEGVEPPALLVVGEVAALREKLAWYEGLPLSGCRVALTRPRVLFGESDGEGWDLTDWHLAGAEVGVYRVLRLELPRDGAELRQAAREAGRFHWILFTSAPGVEAFFAALAEEGADARALAGCLVGAVGPGTAAALSGHGLRADLVPQRHTVQALVEAVCRNLRPGDRVLLPRSDLAASQADPLLRAGAAEVREVVAYHTRPDPEEAGRLARDVEAGRVDVLVLTSASAVRAVAGAARGAGQTPVVVAGAARGAARAGGAAAGPGAEGTGREDVEPPLESAGTGAGPAGPQRAAPGATGAAGGVPLVVAIGPITARACREAGWPPAAEATSHDRRGLLEAVMEAWRRRRHGSPGER